MRGKRENKKEKKPPKIVMLHTHTHTLIRWKSGEFSAVLTGGSIFGKGSEASLAEKISTKNNAPDWMNDG